MNPENGNSTNRNLRDSLSQLPSLEDMKSDALNTAVSERGEESSSYNSSSAESLTGIEFDSPVDTIAHLSDLSAQIKDYRRALALGWEASHVAQQTDQEAEAESLSPLEQAHEEVQYHQIHSHNRKRVLQRADDVHSNQAEKSSISKSRPDWQQHFPNDDSPESVTAYQEWKQQFPIDIQINIEGLRSALDHQSKLLSDPEAQVKWQERSAEQARIYESAAMVRIGMRRSQQIAKEVISLQSKIQMQQRQPNPDEQKYMEALETFARQLVHSTEQHAQDPAVQVELLRRAALDDREAMRGGLLETEGMQEIIETRTPLLKLGKPLLLKGETGGAKTALAKHISHEYFGVEPEIVSGKDDMNSYILMGKTGLQGKDGATETVFKPGPLVRAMVEGRPVIIDEIDVIRTEDLAGLNYILQLRPGDEFTIQEDSGEKVTVQNGFCVIATANMKSEVLDSRYLRNQIDTATQQRFRDGAGEVRVHYPDHEVGDIGAPVENLHLILASLTNAKGELICPPDTSLQTLLRLAKVAHKSQRMFSLPAAVAGGNYVDSQTAVSGKPSLEKAVIAPREILAILQQVNGTLGRLSLTDALATFVSEQEVVIDRVVLAKLLKSHSLLDGVSEASLGVPAGSTEGFNAETNSNDNP